ncbi:unnamed protein product [Effrenium voratum]|nr:unnamed protein product [Effrenium voratum]
MTGPVDSAAKKVIVLIMLALADSPRAQLPRELRAQQSQVLRRAELLLRVACELFEGRKQGAAVAACLLMRNCIRKQVWETSSMPVRQLSNIGDVGAAALHQHGFGTLDGLLAGDPRKIEHVLGRRPPFGNVLQGKVGGVPRLNLRLQPSNEQISICLVSKQMEFASGQGPQLGTGFVHCLAYGTPSGQLLLHRRFPTHHPVAGLVVGLQGCRGIMARLIHEDLVGFDELQVIGDARLESPLASASPFVQANCRKHTDEGKTHGKDLKRQRMAPGGHEATLALARARQYEAPPVQTIQTLSASMPSEVGARSSQPNSDRCRSSLGEAVPGFMPTSATSYPASSCSAPGGVGSVGPSHVARCHVPSFQSGFGSGSFSSEACPGQFGVTEGQHTTRTAAGRLRRSIAAVEAAHSTAHGPEFNFVRFTPDAALGV